MNKRQAKKYSKICYEEIAPTPHGYWKAEKQTDKMFFTKKRPFQRIRQRVKWAMKRISAEKYKSWWEKMYEIEEMSCLYYFRHEPHLEYDIESAFLELEKEIENEK